MWKKNKNIQWKNILLKMMKTSHNSRAKTKHWCKDFTYLDSELSTSTFVSFSCDVRVRKSRWVAHLQAHSLRYGLIRQVLLLHLEMHPDYPLTNLGYTKMVLCGWSEGNSTDRWSEGEGERGKGGPLPCRKPSVSGLCWHHDSLESSGSGRLLWLMGTIADTPTWGRDR